MGVLPDRRRELFCVEYAKTGNGLQSALKAGYAASSAKVQGCRLITDDNIKARIDELRFPEANKNIADVEEILEFLSKSMRGEIEDDAVVIEGPGMGTSEARVIKKPLSHAGRVKAGELLGKARRMFTEQVDITGSMVVFKNEPSIDD